MKIYYLLFIDASSAFTNGPKLAIMMCSLCSSGRTVYP